MLKKLRMKDFELRLKKQKKRGLDWKPKLKQRDNDLLKKQKKSVYV